MKFNAVKSRVVQASLTSFALGLTVLVGATGCKSVKPADPSVKAIKVTERHKMIAGAGSIQLPAGIYHPEFTTRQGVYYRAPHPLVTTGLGSDTVEGGGVYLPNSSDPDNRQGAWLDREERLFGFGVQTPTKVFRFKEQIEVTPDKQIVWVLNDWKNLGQRLPCKFLPIRAFLKNRRPAAVIDILDLDT